MVFSDEEDEYKTYSFKEIWEMVARKKAKSSTDLDDHMSKYFEHLKLLEDKVVLGAPPGIPLVTPGALGDGVVDTTLTSDRPKPSESPYSQFPFVYPKTNPNMPHINHCGPASHFDGTHFPFWQKTSMESHLRSCSEEIWDVVVKGFKVIDSDNMSPREYYDRQLNATACEKIQSALHRALHNQVSDLESAKELWDRSIILQQGTSLIQRSMYEAAKYELNLFMIEDGESLFECYSRLDALCVRIKGLGCDKYQDGFDVNDETIKSKIISIIAFGNSETAST
jgi:hypothetical protein